MEPAGSPVARTVVEQAAGGLLEAGLRFLEALSADRGVAAAGDESPSERVLSSVLRTEPGTNRPVLSIPLPESVTRDRLAGALAALLRGFAGGR